jgi:CCR4-NOT transcription complex subunit 1
VLLIRAGLINVVDQDLQLAKMIVRDYRASVVDFTANLIRECLFSEQPCASRNQFTYSLEALSRAVHLSKATEQ